MTRIDAPWLSSPASRAVCGMLEDAGYAAWFVGGCVRNALLGEPVSDLDISTNARPETVLELAEAAALKAIPTGIGHGTITVVAEGMPFEITTFRKDIETDGRHAVVAFSETLEEDAARRDFTMNALYADASGAVRDPVQGLPDLEARRVRFIGSAEARIREDYLRILRFFRFHAWYGREIDAEGLAACAALAEGLETLSPERVTSEMLKTLAAPDPAASLGAMEQSGVLGRVLPGASIRVFAPYKHLDPVEEADPIAGLAALGGDARGFRLSRAEAKRLAIFKEAMGSSESAGALGHSHGAEIALRSLALRAATFETPLADADVASARKGAAAAFPIRAADLPEGLTGPEIGAALAKLKAAWIASDFEADAQELLSRL